MQSVCKIVSRLAELSLKSSLAYEQRQRASELWQPRDMSISGPALSKTGAHATASLSLHDILNDLERLPRDAEPDIVASLIDKADIPVTSDTVDSSLLLSQQFIDSSKRSLKESEALDLARGRLDRVEAGLQEVAHKVQYGSLAA